MHTTSPSLCLRITKILIFNFHHHSKNLHRASNLNVPLNYTEQYRDKHVQKKNRCYNGVIHANKKEKF